MSSTQPQRHMVPLASVLPGEHLAEAVLDDSGNVLVGEGCELTAGLIQALARRGVTELCMQRGAAAEPADEESPMARHERALARVAHLFRHATQQGRLNPLMHSVLQYRLGQTP